MLRLLHRVTSLAILCGPLAAVCVDRTDAADPPAKPVAADKIVDPKNVWKEEHSRDERWNQTDVGPFLASVVSTPAGMVAKGLTIRLGDRDAASVCYDTKSASLRALWTGGFLKFDPRRLGIVVAPTVAGDVRFTAPPRAWGTLPVRYRGAHQHGRRIVVSYDVDGTAVLESCAIEVDATESKSGDAPAAAAALVVRRSFEIAPHERPLSVSLTSHPKLQPTESASNDVRLVQFVEPEGRSVTFALRTESPAVRLATAEREARLVFDPATVPTRVSVLIALDPNATDAATRLATLVRSATKAEDLAALSTPTEPLWKEKLVTKGTIAANDAAFVVDTLAIPFENPYRALFFVSGHDVFANGDVACCTLHGDVWRVSGIDDRLDRVVWQRYATGLHQPLGLRIIDDKVYVLGRDQITRLHDRNGDGEADFYENFNNDGTTSTGGHDFAACLETDPEGNFYYIRAIEGVCRVSRDGTTHRSIATGFRNPNGLGVGPDGTVTAAPQEGTWTPASSLCEVRDGGYYGFGGPKVTTDRPLGYDPPLCWLPRLQDNSSGGQVWVPPNAWGPLAGRMLHLSYGQCTLLVVLNERVDGLAQGGTVKLPLFFESGAMRGRFSPKDGHLYVSGLRGWETNAAKDGSLQRVRFTGQPFDVPVALHVRPKGIEITFSRKLDPKSAADPGNYDVRQWNYRYSEKYGSDDYRVSDPRRTGRDEVYVEDARLLADGRTVFLELEKVQPVMQMELLFSLKAADGAEFRQTIYSTINAVPKSAE